MTSPNKADLFKETNSDPFKVYQTSFSAYISFTRSFNHSFMCSQRMTAVTGAGVD